MVSCGSHMSQQLRDVVFHWSHVQLLVGLQIIVHCGVVSLLKRLYLSIVRYSSQCSAHLTSLGILLFSVKYIRLFWCFYLILKFYPFMLDKCSCCLCHQKVSMPTGAFFLKFTLLVYFYFHWWQLSTNEQKSNIKNKLSWKVVFSFLEIYKGFFEVQTFINVFQILVSPPVSFMVTLYENRLLQGTAIMNYFR